MFKRRLAQTSASFFNLFLKRYDYTMELVPEGRVIIQKMEYDAIDDSSSREEFRKYEDYARYRTFELVADEIKKKYSSEELSRFCVAEAGVFKGDFTWIINEKLHECEMYLYDTFAGFDGNDLMAEANHSFTVEKRLNGLNDHYGKPTESPDDRIGIVKGKLKYADKCHIRKGYFPDSADREKDKRWVFVSLDMDLYQPMKAGLFYFWPNIIEGGFIFVHDYNNKDFGGIKEAVLEVEREYGRIHKVPIGDQGGTLILCK